MNPSLGILLIPGDLPPSSRSIKRLLLFHNSIHIPNVDDLAFVNENEIVENFHGFGSISWAERGRFPRAEGFEERTNGLIRATEQLQQRGLIHLLPKIDPLASDPMLRLTTYGAAISDENLVRAAIPDFDKDSPPKIPDTILYGCEMAPHGTRSRYEVRLNPPFQLPDSKEWGALAWLRLGRTIKFLEKAQIHGLIPISLDWPGNTIALAFGSRLFPQTTSVMDIADLAISMTAIDQTALEGELDSLSWEEVIKLRQEVLPKISEVRTVLLRRLVRFSGDPYAKLLQYQAEVNRLRIELQEAREHLDAKWKELGFSALIKGGASVSGFGTLVLPSSWLELLGVIALSGATAAAALSEQISGIVTAKKMVKQHPLLFFEKLPKAIGTE